jgi:Ala-tRNA(Pro) deacylase
MATQLIRDYLDLNAIPHSSVPHPQTFTAQRTAQVAHIKGKEFAKTVIVKVDGRVCMAVLPAHCHVDVERLKSVTGARHLDLAREDDLKKLFPDCETGAMPPFGNLYGMEVWVHEDLTRDEQIAFNAGTHTELIRMSYRDYEELVHPVVADFAS